MKYYIEVGFNKGVVDPVGEGLKKDILDLNIKGVKEVHTAFLYEIEGEIDTPAVDRICRELLVDPVIQWYIINPKKSADEGFD